MLNSHAKLFFSTVLLILPFSACSEKDSADLNANRADVSAVNAPKAEIVPRDDVEELGKIVKLNIAPEEAVYLETNPNDKNNQSNVPAPNEKKLVAVMKYSPANAAQITAQAEKIQAAAPTEIEAENWFPAELIAQSQLAGDESLKGTAYAANDFLQTPYINGKLTRISNTDYFILELTTF